MHKLLAVFSILISAFLYSPPFVFSILHLYTFRGNVIFNSAIRHFNGHNEWSQSVFKDESSAKSQLLGLYSKCKRL